MPAAPAATWSVLCDIDAVASCMPGAKITERVDDTHYKGTVTVRLGPANLAFKGEIEVKTVDASTRTLQLLAKGTDSTGGSAASLDLTARVDDAGGGQSALVGTSEASINGKAAAFGGRMMETVADQVLTQFGANFATRVAAQVPPATATPPAPTPAPAAPARDLDGLALAWAVIKSWLRGLFTRKAA